MIAGAILRDVATEHEYSTIREELGRVLSSPGFIRNERLSRFLRFVVERHLEGRNEEIKESLIGVEVFGRKPDYDPKLDSVVRTEAARLRARLAEYYGREGRDRRLVIEIPKGGYLPVFRYPQTTRRAARAAQWEQAEKSFRRAIELDPNRSMTYDNFAMWLLFALGRKDEALRQLRLAEKADPLSPVIQGHLGGVLISAERYDEAERACLKLPVGYSDRKPCLARVRLNEGHIWEALQLLVDARHEFRNPQTDGFLGYVYAKAGRRREAEELAAASQYPNEQVLIFAGLGDKDRTFEALDRIAILGAQRVGRELNFPELAGLVRDDPRLQALRHKVGLPQ